MKVALIAGHDSFKKQGAAVGVITENAFWSEFIQDILPKLNPKHKYKVFHRPNQTTYGYSKAVRILHREIDHWGANLDLEMHFNASSNLKVKGHEVLYYKTSRNGKKYARVLDNCFNTFLHNHDRGLRPVGIGQRGGYQLSIGKSISLISEAFFGSAEIADFSRGGKYREALEKAFIEFTFTI